ncbi:hypothetical protein ACQKM2_40260 [Streptomyces sp. NPDC004126]|uniref:hypothetical protein n=1 Tax=Streptomyces sp. NPDC004126 TaxID=3390695 RepID=UPI003D0288D9
MSTGRFELAYTGGVHGYAGRMATHMWSGTVDGFDPVELRYPVESLYDGTYYASEVVGQGIPSMVFRGIEYGGRPRLAKMELQTDGWEAKVKRRSLAVSRHGRALRIDVAGRSYRYLSVGGRKKHELRREGASVTVTRSEWRLPRRIAGTCQGRVDGMDIGLAILLEATYSRNLTFCGALYSWPGRFLTRFFQLPLG